MIKIRKMIKSKIRIKIKRRKVLPDPKSYS
jgi:hypothetical protein